MLIHLNSSIIAQGHHFAGEGQVIILGFIFILFLELIIALVFLGIVRAILKIQKWRSRDSKPVSISNQSGDGSARSHNEQHRRRS